MKKKITFLIAAAVMLLTMMASTGTMWGQSDYSSDYTGNITLSTTGGSNASACEISIGNTSYAGIKAGTSSKAGAVMITVPSGTKYLHIHAAAWNNTTASLKVTPEGYSDNISLTANSGIANNSPFTFNGDASTSDYYKVITFSDALTANTDLTFTAVGGKRFVIWGVTSEEEGGSDNPSISAENVNIAYNATNGSIEYTVNNPVSGGSLTASTTATWLTTGTASNTAVPFACEENDGVERSATVTLTYTYSAKETVTKNVNVTQGANPNGPGTENNPYTVAQARAAIDAGTGTQGVYATGIVSEIPTAWNSSFNNITFNFVDNSGDTDFLQAYRCGSGTGVDASEVTVGDIVVVYGNLTKYSSTYEFAQGCTLVSLEHPTVAVEAPTFDPEPGTWEYPVDVTMDCATAGVSIYYTMDGSTPTENSTLFDGDEIAVEETTTFKAIAIKGTESSNVTTATYHINSINDPYSVAEALEFLDYPTSTIFVHGIVSTAPTQNPTGSGQLTYYISDDGTTTNQLEVYKGKGLNGDAFTSQDDIQVGDIVTITGIVKIYNSIKEFDTDNYLVEFERPAVPSITLPQYEFSLNADGGDAEIPVTTQNLAADPQLDVMFCDAAGAEYNYGWISGTVSNSTLYGHIDVNEGEPRTAYFKIKGLDANNNWVYSDLVTINQAASAGASIVFNTTSLDIMAGGDNRTMSFDYEGLGNNPTFSVNFYSATGEPTTYSWITAVITAEEKVNITVNANTGAARSAYFKVYGVNGDVNAESNLVTINQEAGGTPTPTGGWILTDLADLTAGDIFVIVGTLGDATYAIQNDNGTNAPGVVAVTVANGALSDEPATNIQWNISGTAANGYTFYPNGDNEKWLYCSTTSDSGNNNNIKVGTGDRKVFVLDNDNHLVTNDDYVDRYLSIYVNSGTAQDWRGYINTNSAPTIAFYKKVVDPSVPSIIANNVSIAYDATEGMIEYNIINPVEGASLEAVPTHGGDVFIMGEAANGTVPFTCSVNPNATERTATVELRYTYNRATITKEVIITQAGAPVAYTNIPDIFAAATGTETNVLVTFDNWVVSGVSTNGKNIFVTDNNGNGFVMFYSSDMSQTYSAGDILSGTAVSCTLKLYNGFAELLNVDATNLSITSGGTVTEVNIDMADLAGVNTGALVHYENLTCSVDNNKYYLTDGTTTLQVYTSLFAFGALEAGKTYNITGVYQQFNTNSGETKEILPRSADDIEEVVITTASITVSPDEINVNAEEHDGTLAITVSNMTITDPNADLAIEFYDGNGTTITKPDWVDFDDFDESGENFSVYYIIAENDGDYRQAFFKVYGMGDTGLVYSNLVSINQEAPVTPPTGDEYDLYSGALVEGDYLIVFDNCAMNTTVTNNRLMFDEVTPDNNVITTDNTAIVWHIAPSGEYWTIYNSAADAYAASTGTKNQATMSSTVDDKALWTVTGTDTYEFVNKNNASNSINANLRKNGTYGFACYATSTGGALSLYKKVVDPSAATIAVSPSTVNAPAAATNGTLTVTYHNINMNTVDIQWTSEEPNWVTLTIDNNNNVAYTISENTDTEARAASFKVTGQNDNTNEDVYSNEITINQAGYVIDYVELPFGFDGGKADIENTVGLTQYDLDSDYNTSPKLKFKNTGSWVVLKFDGVLKSLSYDIKGNNFSGGTFDVELSSDGVNYTSIATYTELGATQTVTLIVDNENARYVRWIYTNKATGNVALGNIYASDTYDIYGEVTMDDLDASATGCIVVEGGVITVTGTITTNGPDDIMINEGGQFIAPNSDFQATLQKQTTHASSWKDGSVDGWYFIASPVDQYETSPMIAFGNYDLFAYSEPDATWYVDHEVWGQPAAHPFTTLERGIGYLYANAADRDMYIAGDMKATSTQISKELSYTSTQSDDVRGFNLMGNPFTRNLGIGDMKFGETEVTVYYGISDEKDAIVSRNIATDPIKPGQGFMIQVNEAGQDLIFNPSSSKGDNNGYISIVAGNESRYDNAFIQIANGNTLRKMNLSDDNTSVYVINDGKDFAAARVEELIGSMPVCFKAAADGEYTITIEAKNAEVEYMHLIDNFTGEDVDLLLDPSYTFTANVGDNEARFRLDFGVNGINEIFENNMFAYQYGNEIIVSGEGQLQIFDVMGRMVMNTTVNGVQNIVMPQGVYILNMNNNIQKIVVR